MVGRCWEYGRVKVKWSRLWAVVIGAFEVVPVDRRSGMLYGEDMCWYLYFIC